MTTNIFETASRQKFRFPSSKGALSTEQLWDLPLTHTDPGVVTLDQVARAVNAELKSVTEESFVATKRSDREGVLSEKLDVVKHVIAVKLAEQEARADVAKKIQERKRLTELLAEKDAEAQKALPREELLKRLAELG